MKGWVDIEKEEKEREQRTFPLMIEGLTPAGFGNKDGKKPCFSTNGGREACNIDFYLPFTITSDMEVAKKILEKVVETYKEQYDFQNPNFVFCEPFEVNGQKYKLNFEFMFNHVLIHRA